jgi:hypothetical protein
MDHDQPGNATPQHARGRHKCQAQPTGWIQPAMPLEDHVDISPQIGEGRPLRQFAVNGRHHRHLEQATADSTHKTSRTTNYREQEQGHSYLTAISPTAQREIQPLGFTSIMQVVAQVWKQ